MFATPRALALSYVDPYVDYTGRVTGYAVVDLRRMGDYDWRLADTNVWKVERMLLDYPHRPIRRRTRVPAAAGVVSRLPRAHHGRKPLYAGGSAGRDLPTRVSSQIGIGEYECD